MTAKEKQLKLLEAFDLRVGDVIEVSFKNGKKRIYKIEENTGDKNIRLFDIRSIMSLGIDWLLYYDFEVIEFHQKTWGEYKCCEVKCSECPIRFLDCLDGADNIVDNMAYTLSDKLVKMDCKFPRNAKGNKIYELCKKMLNEVRDENDIPRT